MTAAPEIITHCSGDNIIADYAGHCPACHKPVFYSADSDGPVWTCPADLHTDNPHREDHEPEREITEEMREKSGIYSNCWEDYGAQCFDPMPVHSDCYESDTW